MGMHNEDDILALLGEYFPQAHASLLLGRGDDCAVLRPGGCWAITCDVFAEDAHFRRRYFSAADAGHKALAVNLSDIASSGARPRGFVTGLTLTGREDEAWLRGFAAGMSALAQRHDVVLAGGDLARAASLNICITAWGTVLPGMQDLRRGRTQPGDVIFAVGTLGLARVGLLLLEETKTPDDVTRALKDWPAACKQHLRPEPLVEQGQALAILASKTGGQFSLMDVSDGLARDLPRLLDSPRTGLGADLNLQETDLPDEVRRYTALHGLNAVSFVFQGGEDYALLGSCPPNVWADQHPTLWTGLGAYRLGTARPGDVTLNGVACVGGGFDHFA